MSEPDLFEERLGEARLSLRTDLSVATRPHPYLVPNEISLSCGPAGDRSLRWGWKVPDEGEWALSEVCALCTPGQGCLWDFIRLHDADDEPERIVAFAQHHGSLGVCMHEGGYSWLRGFVDCPACLETAGVPRHGRSLQMCLRHAADAYLRGRAGLAQSYLTLASHHLDRRLTVEDIPRDEPIEAWLFHARQLRAMLSIMADLRRGAATDLEYWRAAAGLHTGGNSIEDEHMLVWPPPADGILEWFREVEDGLLQHLSGSPELGWHRLAQFATRWIQEEATTEIGLEVAAEAKFFHFTFSASGLRGALAVELAATLCSPLGVYRCDFCGNPYAPISDAEDLNRQVRRPSLDGSRHQFCQTCRADDYLVVKRAQARERYWRKNPTPKRNSKYRSKDGAGG